MLKTTKALQGHVYILVSRNCEFIKIGGTEFQPSKRIKEINASEPYKTFGPWTLHDFRQVVDWRKVEASLHYEFRSKRCKTIAHQKELFSTAPQLAASRLNEVDPNFILKKPKVDRMFQDQDFSQYMLSLYKFTGLNNWLEIQGSWTLCLFPGTGGGRYFTLNIGTHEVAYSSLQRNAQNSTHMILMDSLIRDFRPVKKWLRQHRGGMKDDAYKSALPRATSVFFEGGFLEAQEFLELEGVRRALIAYWSEALIKLSERGALSLNAKHHSWNAVAELNSRVLDKL